MRRFPISWDKTLAQLGFKRRVNRVKRDHYRRKNSRIEPLEVRAMLSVSPGEAPDDQTLSVASFGTDTGRVELLRPEFVLADSAAGDTPDQFEITTEYPDKGSPRAVIKLKEGLERIDRSLQELTIELRLGESVLSRHEVLIDIADARFVHEFYAARERESAAQTSDVEASVDLATARDWLSEVGADGRFSDLKPALESPTKSGSIGSRSGSLGATLGGGSSSVDKSDSAEKLERSQSLERIASITKLELADAGTLSDNADKAAYYRGLEASLKEAASFRGSAKAEDADELRRSKALVGDIALKVGRQISADLASSDTAVADAAAKARAELLKTADPYYTLLSGLKANHTLDERKNGQGRTEYSLNIVEEGTLSVDDTIRVELGGRDAMVQVRSVWASGSSASPRFSALTAELPPIQDAYVSDQNPTTNYDSTSLTSQNDATLGVVESLLRFDLDQYSGSVPTSATVSLTPSSGGGGSVSLSAHDDIWGFDSASDWNQTTATWNSYTNDLQSGFGSAIATGTVPASGTLDLDVTETVQRALLLGDSNLNSDLDRSGAEGDIEAFYLAATDFAAYTTLYGGQEHHSVTNGLVYRNDANLDGVVDGADASRYFARMGVARGDFNLDGVVDGKDYSLWSDNFGQVSDRFGMGDGNVNGVIDAADFTLWQDSSGESFSTPTSPDVTFRLSADAGTTAVFHSSEAASDQPELAVDVVSRVVVESFDTRDGQLRVQYDVQHEAPEEAYLAIYQVVDGVRTALVSNIAVPKTVGQHELLVTTPFNIANPDQEYTLEALIETDRVPNSWRRFEGGVFQTADGSVHAHGTAAEDTITYNNGRVTVTDLGQAFEVETPEAIDFSSYTISDVPGQTHSVGGNTPSHEVLDGGATLKVENNAWKAIALPYTVTANTIVEFDFESTVEGEGHAFAFAESLATNGDNHIRLYGTQGTGLTDSADTPDYTTADGVRHYRIRMGDFYTGSFNYLYFLADNDAVGTGDSIFSNFTIYENSTAFTPGAIDFNDYTLSPIASQTSTVGGNVPFAEVRDGGESVYLEGNTWQSIPFNYTVTADTVVEFDFESTEEGEGHAFAFTNNAAVNGANHLQTYGTQVNSSTPGLQNPEYSLGDGVRHYKVRVGDYYTGAFDTLYFVNDSDATGLGNSTFRNFRVYEDVPNSQPNIYFHTHGADDVLSIEEHTGAHVTLVGGHGNDLYELTSNVQTDSMVMIDDEQGLDELKLTGWEADGAATNTVDLDSTGMQMLQSAITANPTMYFQMTEEGSIDTATGLLQAQVSGAGYDRDIVVTSLGDDVDNNNDDSQKTLREAIEEANEIENAESARIVFDESMIGGVMQTITLQDHDGEGSGDADHLQIFSNLTIEGPGANLLTIEGGELDSEAEFVFRVNDATATISGITATHSTFSAIFSDGSTSNLTVEGVEIIGNKGSGVHAEGAVKVLNSTIANNEKWGVTVAGGSQYPLAVANLENVTLFDNRFSAFQASNAVSTLINVTASENHGGVYAGVGGDITLYNSLIIDNGPYDFGQASGPPGTSVFNTDSSNNLYGVLASGALFPAGTNQAISIANAALDELGNNGGPTRTMALQPGSLAIDAGSDDYAPATDQRGRFRSDTASVSSVTDIGAYEYVPESSLGSGQVKTLPSLTNEMLDLIDTTGDVSVRIYSDIPEAGRFRLTSTDAWETSLEVTDSKTNLLTALSNAEFEAAPFYGGETRLLIDLQDANGGGTRTVVIEDLFIYATRFLVNSLRDGDDMNSGDGFADTGGQPHSRETTLRAAIQEAEAHSSYYTTAGVTPEIVFDESIATEQTIELELGEIVLSKDINIIGPGADKLTIDANGSAENERRAFLVQPGAVVSISGVAVTGGYRVSGNGTGGAISNLGNLTLDGVNLHGNQADSGGAIFTTGMLLTVTDSRLTNNVARAGGAIRSILGLGENVLIDGVTIDHNRAVSDSIAGTGNAGAILIGKATSGDGSHGSGDTADGVFEIKRSTISNNTAPNLGGIDIRGGNLVKISDTTIAENSGSTDDSIGVAVGGLRVATNDMYERTILERVLVAENIAVHADADPEADNLPNNLIGNISSSSKDNLFGTNGSSPASAANGSNNVLLNFGDDAGLTPLGDHGGPQPTHALKANSPARNPVGASPAPVGSTDQRGILKTGNPDIGAFEFVGRVSFVAADNFADFDGDGREDGLAYDSATGSIIVELAGNQFGDDIWAVSPSGSFAAPRVGDFNGDGRDDIAFRTSGNDGKWTFGFSESTRFHLVSTPEDNVGGWVDPDWSVGEIFVGDFDGDGRDELIGRYDSIGDNNGTTAPGAGPDSNSEWRVLDYSTDASFSLNDAGHSLLNDSSEFAGKILVGDANRDGRDDLIAATDLLSANDNQGSGPDWFVSVSRGQSESVSFASAGSQINWGDWFDGHYHSESGALDADGPLRFVTEKFAQVYNNVELELYHGIKKGPLATEETGAASPWDQAALLTQLLSGVHRNDNPTSLDYNRFQPTLVTGDITVPVETAAAWVGAKEDANGDYPALTELIKLLDPQYTGTAITPGNTVTFRHAWVRVNLPAESYSVGGGATQPAYVDLDPSWKFKDYQPGIDLPDRLFFTDGFDSGLFDEIKFLDSTVEEDPDPNSTLGFRILPDTPLEFFEGEVQQWLVENDPGKSLADVPYDGPLLNPVVAVLPQGLGAGVVSSNTTQQGAYNLESLGISSDIIGDSAKEEELTYRFTIESRTGSTFLWSLDDFVFPEEAHSRIGLAREYSASADITGASIVSNGINITPVEVYIPNPLAGDVPVTFSVYTHSPGESRSAVDPVLQVTLDENIYLGLSFHGRQASSESVERAQTAALDAVTSFNTGEPAVATVQDLNEVIDVVAAGFSYNKQQHVAHIAEYTHSLLSSPSLGVTAIEAPFELVDTSSLGQGFDSFSPVEIIPAYVEHISERDETRFVDLITGQASTEARDIASWQEDADFNAAVTAHTTSEPISATRLLQRAYAGQESFSPTTNGAASVTVLDLTLNSSGVPVLVERGFLFSDFSDASAFEFLGGFSVGDFPYNPTGGIEIWALSDVPGIVTLSDVNSGNIASVRQSIIQTISTYLPFAELESEEALGSAFSYGISTDGVPGAFSEVRSYSVFSIFPVSDSLAGGSHVSYVGAGEGISITGIDDTPTHLSLFGLENAVGFGAPPRFGGFGTGTARVSLGSAIIEPTLDIDYPNSGASLNFSRSYISTSDREIGLGRGWTHSFSDRLIRVRDEQTNNFTNNLIWYTSEGAEHFFEWDATTSTFKSPSQLLGNLVPTLTDGSSAGPLDADLWTYTARDGSKVIFEDLSTGDGDTDRSPRARLRSKIDLNGNGIRVAYTGPTQDLISAVHDIHTYDNGTTNDDRKLRFLYGSSAQFHTIEKHAPVDGQDSSPVGTWTYQYDNLVLNSETTAVLRTVTAPTTGPSGDKSIAEQVVHEYTYYDNAQGDAEVWHGLMRTAEQPNGDTTAFDYYVNGRLFRSTDGEGHSETYSYDLINGRTVVTDANGEQTTFFYNEDGLVTRVINPDRTRTETEWGVRAATPGGSDDDDFDSVVDGTEFLRTSSTDETGAVVTYAYHATGAGGVTAGPVERELQSITSHRYLDSGGAPVDPAEPGVVTTFDYVKKGDVVAVKNTRVDPTGEDRRTINSYDGEGRLLKITDAVGGVTEFEYYLPTDTSATNHGLLKSTSTPRAHFNNSAENYSFERNEAVRWRVLDEDFMITESSGDLIIKLDGNGIQDGRTIADAVRVEQIEGPGGAGTGEGLVRIIDDEKTIDTSKDFYLSGLGGVSDNEPSSNAFWGDAVSLSNKDTVATWRFRDLEPGRYRISTTWVEATNRRDNVRYEWHDSADESVTYSVFVDQTEAPNSSGENFFDAFESTFEYDAAGNVTRVRRGVSTGNPAGGLVVSETDYHHTGGVLEVKDGTGRETQSVYDVLGRLHESILVGDDTTLDDDLVAKFEFDQSGQLEKTIDALGRVTQNTYDNRGLIETVVYADGSTVHSSFDAVGNLVSVQDELGRETRFFYDSRDRLIETVLPDGERVAQRYDGVGRVVERTDAEGRVSTFEYDAAGRLLQTVTAQGKETEITASNAYNILGDLISTTDGEGNVTLFDYDKLGRVIKTRVYNGATTSSRPVFVSTTAYDLDGNLAETVLYDTQDIPGAFSTAQLNDAGLRDSIPTAGVDQSAYQITTQRYDSFGRSAETVFADETAVKTEYDVTGRVRFAENERGARSESRYDEHGRLETTLLPDPVTGLPGGADSPVSTQAYDSVGNVISTTDPNGNTTTYRFDDRNRIVSMTDAVGSNSETLFDKAGQVIATVNALGVAIASQYDSRGRIVRRSWSDPDGSGSTDTGAAPVERFEYDGVGNLIEQTDPRGYVSTFKYDDQNRLVEERVTRSHILGGVVVILPDNQDAITTYKYDNNSNLTKLTDANQKDTDYTYDALNRVLTETLPPVDDYGNPSVQVREGTRTKYDGYGNVVESARTNTGSASPLRFDVFEYDARNRLVVETFNSGASGGDAAKDLLRNVYEYDEAGNLIALKEAVTSTGAANPESVTTRYEYDMLNRQEAIHLGADFNNPVVASRHSSTFSYDANGNLKEEVFIVRDEETPSLTSQVVTAYEYDGVNRLIATIEDSGASPENRNATYRTGYDAVGNVVFESDPTGVATTYEYDDLLRLVKTSFDDPTPVDGEGSLLIETFEYDTAGNLLAVTDAEGVRTESEYNTFGQVIEERIVLPSSADIVTEYAYDGQGRNTRIITPGGNFTLFGYDNLGRVTSETQGNSQDLTGPDRNTREYQYDRRGNLAETTDRNGRVVRYTHDGLDRLTQEKWFADTVDATSGSVDNTLIWSLDRRGRITAQGNSYAGDTLPSPVHIIRHLETFTYDVLDRITLHRNHVNAQEDFVEFGGATTPYNPELDQEYKYDILAGVGPGELSSYRYKQTLEPNGDPTDQGQVAVYANSIFVTDNLGRLSKISEQGNTAPFKRDITAKEIVFSYDDAGRMTGVSRRAGSGSSQLTNTGADFQFDTNYSHDAAGRLASISHDRGATSEVFATHAYQYDNASRVIGVNSSSRFSQVVLDRQETHSYDQAGRLANWTQTVTDLSPGLPFDLAAAATTDIDYNPDLAGNVTDNSQSITSGEHNRVDSDGDYNYLYDNEGNLTQRARTSDGYIEQQYTWDHRNRLTQILKDPGTANETKVEYVYNNDDLRVRRAVYTGDALENADPDTVEYQQVEHYVYDGGQLAAVIDGVYGDNTPGDKNIIYSNGRYQRRVQNGAGVDQPLFEEVFREQAETMTDNFSRSDSAEIGLFWAATDHAGSVRDVLDNQGDLVNHLEYDAYGELLAVVDGQGQPVDDSNPDPDRKLLAIDAAFAGREWDAEAGLYYNRARWYDAAQSRFISQDPIGFSGGDTNLYRYAGGNPAAFRDPSGLISNDFGSAFGGFDFDFSFGFDFSFDTSLDFLPGSNFDFIGFGDPDPFRYSPVPQFASAGFPFLFDDGPFLFDDGFTFSDGTFLLPEFDEGLSFEPLDTTPSQSVGRSRSVGERIIAAGTAQTSEQLAARAARGNLLSSLELGLRNGGEGVRNISGNLAELVVDNTQGSFGFVAALGGAVGSLVQAGGEALAGVVDFPGTLNAGIRDVGQAVTVGEQRGVALGVGQFIGTNQIAAGIVGNDINGQEIAPADAFAEGIGRLSGTVLSAATPFASVRGGAAPARRAAAEVADPRGIRFTQDTVSPNFSDGGTLTDAVRQLRSGQITAADFPTIRVVERNGQLFSLDNRRLTAFKAAQLDEVPVQRLNLSDPAVQKEFARKFRPVNGGLNNVVVPSAGRAEARRVLREFGK